MHLARSSRARHARSSALLLCAVALIAAACSSTNGNNSGSAAGIPAGPITVGGIYPLSGPYAAYGKSEEAGTAGLIDYLNSKGGIDGHKLKFISLNDQLDPTIAATDAEQLISDNVKAVFSVGTETEAPSDVPIFMKAKIPVIFYNPGDTWGDATKWPYYYKTGWGTNDGSIALANYAKSLGITKIGLASDNSGFGMQSAQDFINQAKVDGLTIVKSVYYPPTVVSLGTQMASLKAAGAKGVFITGGGGYNQAFAAMTASGWHPYIFSYASILQLPQMGGLLGTSLAKDAYVDCDGYALKPGGTLPAFYSQLTSIVEKATGPQQNPGTAVIFGYDDLLIYKYAVEKANSVSGPAVQAVLNKVTDKSFTMPGYTYTYTPTNHNGLTFVPPICSVALGFGPQQNPYLAPGQSYPPGVPG